MTHAHEADDWTGDFTITHSDGKNLVARCPQCGTEKGERVPEGTTIGPHYSINSHCVECSTWTDHYPIREATRGEYDD